MSDFRHMVSNKGTQKRKLSTEELGIRLSANNRGGYKNLLRQPQYKELLTQMLNNPNLIMDLPEAKTEEDAKKYINSEQSRQYNLMQRGILSVNNTGQTLNDLTREQLLYIENKLGWLIQNWANIVFHNVWLKAKQAGVQHLYMNTSQTVSKGLSDSAKKVMYESYPKQWGFKKNRANLRGKDEEFWYRRAKRVTWIEK